MQQLTIQMIEEEGHSLLEGQLMDAINESLANHMGANAAFLAERLMAERDSQENRTLLAQCYMAENKHHKVFYILKDCRSEAARYKYAVSCVKIGRYKEAEKALVGSFSDIRTPKTYESVPNGSYGLYLLGVITEKLQRYGEAKDFYFRALEMNPTLWTAYEKLGKLGQNIMPNKMFTEVKMRAYESGGKKLITRKKKEEDTKRTTQSLISRKKSTANNEPQFLNLMGLLRKFAEGYYNLCMYNCAEAIEQFKRLPQQHLNTGWVLTSIGRAYTEVVKYSQAANYYEQAFKLQPYRLQGVQYYSSCLWHLKKQVQLCYLAHQSLQKSIYSSEAWIAVGNCFSLQKQHQMALKFFNRAISLNPQNPYAQTLCGHEHVYVQEFAKAKKMFENALSFDVRHYSAWWGLGNICYKQQKYDKAVQHFIKAISINQKNPILFSFLGMTHAANRNFTAALTYFDTSEKLDAKNGLNKYQKANTLVKLQKYEEAVNELEALHNFMPKEPPIPMLLGKIYKKLGKVDKAHLYFTLALDLESKDTQKIKGFIESLGNADNEKEQMEL